MPFDALIGFAPNPPIIDSMSDSNAQGTFPHRLAVNEWQGRGAPAAAADAAGLHRLELSHAEVHDYQQAVAALERTANDVRRLDGAPGVRLLDPSGISLHLSAPRLAAD